VLLPPELTFPEEYTFNSAASTNSTNDVDTSRASPSYSVPGTAGSKAMVLGAPSKYQVQSSSVTTSVLVGAGSALAVDRIELTDRVKPEIAISAIPANFFLLIIYSLSRI
jgi:hypothetical protein